MEVIDLSFLVKRLLTVGEIRVGLVLLRSSLPVDEVPDSCIILVLLIQVLNIPKMNMYICLVCTSS